MKELISIEVKNAKKLIQAFESGNQVAESLLVKAMQQSVDLTATNAAVYPATSEANQPPTPYYIRGTGTQMSPDKNRGESEQLGQKWEKLVEIEANGVVGTVKNQTSYGPWVHGMLGQQAYHRQRGWRRVSKIASDVRQQVNNIFKVAARELARHLRTGKA